MRCSVVLAVALANVWYGSVAAGGPQGYWAAAMHPEAAAQIIRIASLPQAEIGQNLLFGACGEELSLS